MMQSWNFCIITPVSSVTWSFLLSLLIKLSIKELPCWIKMFVSLEKKNQTLNGCLC